ncbi:MAG: hypothetical protein ACXQT1_03095 [Methermicoccaceae archaeon]
MSWRVKTIMLLIGVFMLALATPVIEHTEHIHAMGEIVLFTLAGCGYYVLVMLALPHLLQREEKA